MADDHDAGRDQAQQFEVVLVALQDVFQKHVEQGRRIGKICRDYAASNFITDPFKKLLRSEGD
jgi:hypothetical protein